MKFCSTLCAFLHKLLRQYQTGFKPAPSPAPAKPVLSLDQINLRQMPLLSAAELIELLNLHNLLRTIKRLAAVSETHWQMLYQPALYDFLEICQLAPASMAHHHAGPGGLAAHTLESVAIALQWRKPLVLPRNADPDTSVRQEPVWTYAIFTATLLHDHGKLLTATRLRLNTGILWSPYSGSPLKSCAQHYRIEFLTFPYKLHARLASAGLRLLPEPGVEWLSQYPEILGQICAYLYGDYFEAGVIGELAQRADGESLARNLKLGGDRQRFPHAPAIPLVDRLIIGLRQMLECNELKLNQNGADGWTDGEFVWLVCGTVARKLIEHLHQAGMTQIPTDHNRVFDTLQEHDFILPTPEGKAIWRMEVNGPNAFYRFELTMLKFEICRLIPPGRRPALFAGSIRVANPAASTASEATESTSEVSTLETPSVMDEPTEAAVENTTTQTKIGAVEFKTNLPALGFDDIRPATLDDNTGQCFMDWVARMVRHDKLTINRKDAMVHIVPEGVLLVSPRIFKEFVAFFDLYRRNELVLSADDAAKQVQKRVEKLRQNIKTAKGMSVHSYIINGSNRVSRITGFLFEPVRIFGPVTPPPCNELLLATTRQP